MSDCPPIATSSTPEQVWAGPSGAIWRENVERLEAMLQPFAEILVERAVVSPGQNVLDIGCGGGATSLLLARQVLPGGHVTGIDISPPLVELAQKRASAMAAAATFRLEDAAKTTLPENTFDHLVSRFGVMFFSDPIGAFARLATRLTRNGTFTLVVWSSADRNLWIGNLRRLAAKYTHLPPEIPHAPGPTAFADVAYVTHILEKAGLSGISVETVGRTIYIGGLGNDPRSAAEFLRQTSSFARQSFDLPQPHRAALFEDLVTTLTPYQTPDGVAMPAEALVIKARR